MKIKGLRIQVIVIACILTLTVIFGGKYLVEKLTVEKPLLDQLNATDDVKHAEIKNQHNQLTVTIELKNANSFPQAYQAINRDIQQIVGKTPYKLVINDQRSPSLEQAYFRISPYLQEAISRGNFWSMFIQVDKELGKMGITQHELTVDNDYVYVFMGNKGHTLYQVVSRNAGQPVTTDGQGVQ